MRKFGSAILAIALLVGFLGLAAPPASAVGFGTVTGTAYDWNGSPLPGVQVAIYGEDDVFGSPLSTSTTGIDGTYTLLNVPAPNILVAAFTFPDGSVECYGGPFANGSLQNCMEGSQVVVNVIEDITTTGIDIIQDPPTVQSCDPAGTNNGLTNVGFETGDFTGWTEGLVVDDVAVTMADAFTSPYEGTYMARLGLARESSSVNQPEGPNVICQSFVVDQAVERFTYNIFTYDYTGFDRFEFAVNVVDPATGELIAASQQGAWGSGTALKTTGWRGVELDLASRLGDTLELKISAGGTSDTLYGFWAYIDSAETGLPPEPVALAEAESATGSVMLDPVTGQVTIAQPVSQPSDLTISTTVACPTEGEVPDSVNLLLNGTPFAMTETPPGSGNWVTTIPAASMVAGTLSVQANCPGGAVATIIGGIVLYDPSGYLTDAETGDPVAGAEVTLFKVPGWTAATEPGELGPTECESNLSKPAEQAWSQPAPTELGVEANPLSGEIDPQVNPFVSNADGYYGWDVAAGCWYVVVEADGYAPLTSPVVGVPPEVTDLDLELTPSACGETQAGPFPDVAGTHVFCHDIEWLAISEITGGFEDGTFRPAADITRGSMAAFLYRYAGSPEFTPPAEPTFPDVPTTHVFYKEIEWAAAEGITTGATDGTFKPAASITRGSMAAFFYRMADEPAFTDPDTPTFPDVPAANVFFTEVEWLVEVGVTEGFDDGTYRPATPVTRGGFAAFLHRFDDLGLSMA